MLEITVSVWWLTLVQGWVMIQLISDAEIIGNWGRRITSFYKQHWFGSVIGFSGCINCRADAVKVWLNYEDIASPKLQEKIGTRGWQMSKAYEAYQWVQFLLLLDFHLLFPQQQLLCLIKCLCFLSTIYWNFLRLHNIVYWEPLWVTILNLKYISGTLIQGLQNGIL